MEGKWDTSRRLSEVVLEYMRDNNISKQLIEHRAVSLWQVVVGPTVNNATRNVSIYDGVLYVELKSSVVRQELLMLKSQIIKNFEVALGPGVVTDIVLR